MIPYRFRIFRPVVVAGVALALLLAACSNSDPSQSPQRIAFTIDDETSNRIYAADASSGQVASLTDPAGSDWSPKWAPNRSRIAFISNRNNTPAIWVMDPAGAEEKTAITAERQIDRFEWAPDSERVAFQTTDAEGNSRVHIGDVTDGSAFALTLPIDGARLGGWSPDGVWVVYSAHGSARQGIVRANPNGVNEIIVTEDEAFDPVWSPNGSLIAYIREVEGQRSIFVSTPDGEDERNLTPEGGDNYDFTWAPNGGHLAFVSDRDGNPEIYVVDIEGEDLDRLTNNRADDLAPDWSNRTNRIAFISNIHGHFDIFTMEPNGEAQKRVTANSQRVAEPDW